MGSGADPEAIAEVVASIGRLKGVSMKIGQIMSYIDVALPAEVRSALSVLQTHAQPMPLERVKQIVTEELDRRADDVLRNLEPTPIAAASIGQVHRSRLSDGVRVAVKVQYPEVERAIESDFKPAVFGKVIASMVYPGANVDALLAEARVRLLEECDYRREASVQRRFATIYRDDPILVVPRVNASYSSRRVLTSAWMDGSSFDSFLESEPSQGRRDRVGEALVRFYIGSLFEHGIYNCDPHPGNWLFLQYDRLGMLDYGCTREFTSEFVSKLAMLTLAAHADDRTMLLHALEDLGILAVGQRGDFDTARGLVRAFYGPMLVDATQPIELGEVMSMRNILDSKRDLMKLNLPGEFLFLFRIRFGLMSILARLGAQANWYRLERRWAEAAAQRA